MLRYFAIMMIISSCAIKHHIQVGDIERVPGKKLIPFKVLLSETGVNIKEAGKLISAVTNDQNRGEKIAQIISLFQMGPRTGNLIYNEKYADVLPELILTKCPSGKITGLTMVRESNKYPVVSGEIIKLTGFCVK